LQEADSLRDRADALKGGLRFIADCRAARTADRSSKTICEVVKRAVSDPAGLLRSLGEPDRADIKEIYRQPDLSILNVVWAPHMMVMPHNHHMWAIIGVYGGREDNIFWRRIAEAGERQLEAAGARSLGVKDALPLGEDIVHSVTNPTSKFTAATFMEVMCLPPTAANGTP
jgi:predicted metal-dependent enzyme (double-stranded beta helix superfamily)